MQPGLLAMLSKSLQDIKLLYLTSYLLTMHINVRTNLFDLFESSVILHEECKVLVGYVDFTVSSFLAVFFLSILTSRVCILVYLNRCGDKT